MNKACLSIVGLAVLLAPAVVVAETVGNIGAVNQNATGTPPGAKSRKITLGLGVQNKEKIETSADGSAQVVFLDTSTMTIGHGSRVVVDRFVYSGNQSAGQQSLNLTKGALRFIGGAVSHSPGAGIKVPNATLAVRGGMVTVNTESQVEGVPGTTVYLEYGTVEINGVQNTVLLSRAGFYVLITPDGRISEPKLATPEIVEALAEKFISETGQSGGVSQTAIPTEAQAQVALRGISVPNFSPWDGLNSIAAQWFGNALTQSRAQAVNQGSATQFLEEAIAASQHPPSPPSPPPTPPTPPTPPQPPTPPTPPIPPTPPQPPSPPPIWPTQPLSPTQPMSPTQPAAPTQPMSPTPSLPPGQQPPLPPPPQPPPSPSL